VSPEDVPRLSNQCRQILERLRIGPASNIELAQIALKYTSRISDLRAAGYEVRCKRGALGTGQMWYDLVKKE
jgi:hypothetical protein